jgi:DUF4097 and DUF4098 domain-containing protein YvlB
MNRQRILSLLVVLCGSFCLATAAQATTVTRTFPAGETGNLIVRVQSGDIRIETGKSEVRVTAMGIKPSEQKNLEISQEGPDVYVSFEPEEGYGDARFEIGVPAGFDLNLKTSGGDVRIAGYLAGNMTAVTSGGDIQMEDVDGSVKSTTAGGDIQAGTVGGDAEFKTAGGDIEVLNVSGEVDASTAGGDIEIGDVGSRLKASTAGGDITLKNVGGEATASTAGGDIEVGEVAGSATLKTAGGDLRLLSASGQVTAKTAGGDLDLKNVTGSIEGKTAGGDINAELIPSGGGPSTLKTSGGDLVIALPASASATISATIKISGNWEKKKDEFDITSEFGTVDVVRDQSKREIRAQITLGGGGEQITLATSNGDIAIKSLAR